YGYRLQRNERALHRGAQAEIQLAQSSSPRASDRPGKRIGNELRPDYLQRGHPSSCGPDAGLRALRGVLKPDGGATHLMVYAPYGRSSGGDFTSEFAEEKIVALVMARPSISRNRSMPARRSGICRFGAIANEYCESSTDINRSEVVRR